MLHNKHLTVNLSVKLECSVQIGYGFHYLTFFHNNSYKKYTKLNLKHNFLNKSYSWQFWKWNWNIRQCWKWEWTRVRVTLWLSNIGLWSWSWVVIIRWFWSCRVIICIWSWSCSGYTAVSRTVLISVTMIILCTFCTFIMVTDSLPSK